MMNNKLRYTSSNIVEIVVVLAILVVLNYLGYRFFHRFDMTENRQFTISQATKNVLSSLDDPVSVELFLSRDLPPALMPVRDDVRDRLDEYVAYGHGKFKLQVTDPGDDEEVKQRAQQLGIQEQQIQVTQRDALSVQKVFFGLVLSFEDRNEVMGTSEITDIASLEYGLTSKLVKLTMDHKPKVGLFAGTFSASQQQQQQGPTYDGIRQILSGPDGMYEVVNIDPQADRQLPDDLEGLIIAGSFGMSESLRYSVDQFIMNGGQVFIAVDPMMQAQQQGGPNVAYPSLPTIEEQLEKYGVRFNKQLIADPSSCGQAQIPTSYGAVIMNYLLWPEIGPRGFSQDVGAVSQLESLVMPWSCPLVKIDVEGVKYTALAQTTKDAFTMASPFNLEPEQDWEFLKTTAGSTGPYDVAVLLEGNLPTAFPDGPPAQATPPPGEESPVTMDPVFNAADQVLVSKGTGRVIVISSAVGLSDGFMRQFNQNALYLVNTIDMLLTGDELLGIRSSPVTKRPLKTLTEAQKSFYRWINILGVPILLVLFGILLWFIKSRHRLAIAQRYGG